MLQKFSDLFNITAHVFSEKEEEFKRILYNTYGLTVKQTFLDTERNAHLYVWLDFSTDNMDEQGSLRQMCISARYDCFSNHRSVSSEYKELSKAIFGIYTNIFQIQNASFENTYIYLFDFVYEMKSYAYNTAQRTLQNIIASEFGLLKCYINSCFQPEVVILAPSPEISSLLQNHATHLRKTCYREVKKGDIYHLFNDENDVVVRILGKTDISAKEWNDYCMGAR